MIKLILMFLVGTTIYSTNLATKHDFLEEHYIGGEQAFLNYIYQHINYPPSARDNCTMGFVKINLPIEKSGEIGEINFYNQLGNGIEQEIARLLTTTLGSWKTSSEERNIELLFNWRINEDAVGGMINIAAGVPDAFCESTQRLEKMMKKFVKKNKYKKARSVLNELKNRDPYTNAYQDFETALKNRD